MADIIFNKFFEKVIEEWLDAGPKVIKLVLIMSTSTLESAQATERDVVFVGDITTLDEADGTGFSWGHGFNGRKTVTMVHVVDNTNDLGSMESATGTYTWATLGVCAASITGVLLIVEGATNDTDAPLVAYYQFAAPRPADGNDFVVNFNVGGGEFIKFTQGV